MSSRARRASGLVGALALAITLAACSSGGSSTTTTTAGGGASASSGANAAPDSNPTSITVGTSGATGVYLPLYVGVQAGVFQKYGLNVKVQTLTPAAVTAATLSDNVNIGWDGPGTVGGILSNPSAKVFATFGPTVFYLYAKKGTKSIQDLKGETVGVTTPGGAIDGAVRAAIKKAGLTPGVDVKIAYLQTNSAALAAVETGSVQAAGVSPPTSIQATQAGLVDLENITPLAPPSILAVNSQWASANKAALIKFITAFKAAVQLSASNEADAAAALKQYVKLTDQSPITGTWTAYKQVWAVGPYPDDQMKAVLQQLATSNPPVKGASTAQISSIVDNEYVNAAG
jgi:ABC-type nitrate/sulfonate/bicarbonate transport system substrate-binding protein